MKSRSVPLGHLADSRDFPLGDDFFQDANGGVELAVCHSFKSLSFRATEPLKMIWFIVIPSEAPHPDCSGCGAKSRNLI